MLEPFTAPDSVVLPQPHLMKATSAPLREGDKVLYTPKEVERANKRISQMLSEMRSKVTLKTVVYSRATEIEELLKGGLSYEMIAQNLGEQLNALIKAETLRRHLNSWRAEQRQAKQQQPEQHSMPLAAVGTEQPVAEHPPVEPAQLPHPQSRQSQADTTAPQQCQPQAATTPQHTPPVGTSAASTANSTPAPTVGFTTAEGSAKPARTVNPAAAGRAPLRSRPPGTAPATVPTGSSPAPAQPTAASN